MSLQKKFTQQLGNLGEAYVILELAKKGLYATRVPGCSFDILVQNGKRVEVKSSKITKNRSTKKGKDFNYRIYSWGTGKRALMSHNRGRIYYAGYKVIPAYSDYFVFIGFKDDNVPERFYIVPTEVARKATAHSVYLDSRKGREPLAQFRDKWEYLL
jgi:hypothetical protein